MDILKGLTFKFLKEKTVGSNYFKYKKQIPIIKLMRERLYSNMTWIKFSTVK